MSGYRTQSEDTDPETERILFDAYRRMEPWEKARIVSELTRASAVLAIAGLRDRHPELSDEEIHLRLAELRLGPELLAKVLASRRAG